MEHKQYWLYVLNCEQNKKYVGITSKTPEARMKQHQNDFLGAAWTKKYKPIDLFYKQDLGEMERARAEKYENKVVRTYMNKYGYNNVRGGDLTQTKEYLKRFGYYVDKEEWDKMTYFVLLLVIILIQGLMYYLK